MRARLLRRSGGSGTLPLDELSTDGVAAAGVDGGVVAAARDAVEGEGELSNSVGGGLGVGRQRVEVDVGEGVAREVVARVGGGARAREDARRRDPQLQEAT